MDKQLQVSNNTSLQNHPSDDHHHHQEEDAVLFHCSHQTYSESKQISDDHQWSLLQENNVFDEKELQAFHDPPYIINNSSDFFQRIMATKIPDKTVQQQQQINCDHFQVLQVDDIKLIELEKNCFFSPICTKPNMKITQTSSSSNRMINMTSSVHHPTKKGARWTKEEHEKFLMGLSRYGKGDWRNISRNCVITKTPTQVASHAQKYFIRLAKKSSSTSDQDLSFKP